MSYYQQTTHVVIVDGTLSRLDNGYESNAGLLYKMLREVIEQQNISLYYDPGIRGAGMKKWFNAAAGIGINMSICASYAHLSKYYLPGDRIMLFGYSRGAYAVRSLAGMIGRIGLVKPKHRTTRRVRKAFNLYESSSQSNQLENFVDKYCRDNINIEMIGVWDTVKALGLPFPLLSRIAPMATEFHDHHLGPSISNAFHALALDETRNAYSPILWECVPGWKGHAEQLWFPGAHADIGGQIEEFTPARPLSNVPLIWMLEKAVICGLELPDGWQKQFTTDPAADMYGDKTGLARFFLSRSPRRACETPFDGMHVSVGQRQEILDAYTPKAIVCLPEDQKV